MNRTTLLNKNIRYFARYYRLVAVAVVVTVAVIVGSLVIGDSVRQTLVGRVAERLGTTETILFSRNSFLPASITDMPLLAGSARGVLLTDGFISRQGRLVPVFVWGVKDSTLAAGSARINRPLAEELALGASEEVVLRLPATGMVPSGSLFVTDNYTTSLRLAQAGTLDASDGGNLNLKNEQTLPFNIFVRRDELGEAIGVEGRINLILSDKHIEAADWEGAWTYALSGLKVDRREGFTEISSDRVFLQKEVVETLRRDNPATGRLFSYLANAIGRKEASIPYSFITAMDSYGGETLQSDEVILSDYSAARLKAGVGDTIRISYYTSKGLKTLATDSVALRVSRIVPLAELRADSTLSADFPGLSDVERCTDWDSDLPIRMELIEDEDEDYWNRYRSTPKAIVAYDAVAADWSNAYGTATAIRLPAEAPDLSGLRADMFGIQRIAPREAALSAARSGVDFSGLFLALGSFIIVSALLLMLNPLAEMFYHRRDEIGVLRALGYTRQRMLRLLWQESLPVVGVAAAAGVVAGLLYTGLVMWLLGGVWQGATQTNGFAVYPSVATIAIGIGVSLCMTLGLLYRAIARALKEGGGNAQPASLSLQRKRAAAGGISLLTVAVIGINVFYLHSVTLFMSVGALLLAVAALWGDYLVCRNGSGRNGTMNLSRLTGGTLLAGRRQSLQSFFALSIGVFIVFSVGLNRKGFADSSQLLTGTGGYTLWCESSVPVYYDLSTTAGRDKLSLAGLPRGAEVLQCLRYSADDASCLNLNKVVAPTVLGVDMEALAASHFRIEQSIFADKGQEAFLRFAQAPDSVYPALVDATVLTWSIGMSLGDTLRYEDDQGRQVSIRLAGTLSNSIFQGNILIDRRLFADIWKETTGSEVFLLRVEEAEAAETKALLAQALSEYGVRVSTTNDRLGQFNTVTDTYLTIFMTLGGLGLLLGIMSFIVVIRKSLVMRRGEIDLYRRLGFTAGRIEKLLYREHAVVPLCAIGTGVVSALVGVGVNFRHAGVGVWLLAAGFTVVFVVCVVVFVQHEVRQEVNKTDL